MLHLMSHKAFSYSMEWMLLHGVTMCQGTLLYVVSHSEPQTQGGPFGAATASEAQIPRGSEGQNPEQQVGSALIILQTEIMDL